MFQIVQPACNPYVAVKRQIQMRKERWERVKHTAAYACKVGGAGGPGGFYTIHIVLRRVLTQEHEGPGGFYTIHVV